MVIAVSSGLHSNRAGNSAAETQELGKAAIGGAKRGPRDFPSDALQGPVEQPPAKAAPHAPQASPASQRWHSKYKHGVEGLLMPHFLSTNLHFTQPSFFPLLSSKKRAESGVSPLFQRHAEHCGAYCDSYVGNKQSELPRN